MTQEEIEKLVVNKEITITDVIDAYIKGNAIIGVGLITLGDVLRDYCRNKLKKLN